MPQVLTLPEDKGVELWRLQQFLELTGDPGIAKLLALSHADLAKARVMVEAGCSPSQLARILV